MADNMLGVTYFLKKHSGSVVGLLAGKVARPWNYFFFLGWGGGGDT